MNDLTKQIDENIRNMTKQIDNGIKRVSMEISSSMCLRNSYKNEERNANISEKRGISYV